MPIFLPPFEILVRKPTISSTLGYTLTGAMSQNFLDVVAEACESCAQNVDNRKIKCWNASLWRRHDRDRSARTVHDIYRRVKAMPTDLLFITKKIVNLPIKQAVERFTYIIYHSSVSRLNIKSFRRAETGQAEAATHSAHPYADNRTYFLNAGLWRSHHHHWSIWMISA